MPIAYRKGSHSFYSIVLNVYFVTAYRRECLSTEMIERAEAIASRVLLKHDCFLLEFSGESNQVHCTVDMHPAVAPSVLFGSVKGAISRILRKEFEAELRPYFENWEKGLWGDQLYIGSAGGAPVEALKQYIDSRRRG